MRGEGAGGAALLPWPTIYKQEAGSRKLNGPSGLKSETTIRIARYDLQLIDEVCMAVNAPIMGYRKIK